MIALQLISKVLNTGNYSIIENNMLTKDYFVGYEDEYDFISNHVKQYGNVPDKFFKEYKNTDVIIKHYPSHTSLAFGKKRDTV